jgi:parallel beta-helix repeat protein
MEVMPSQKRSFVKFPERKIIVINVHSIKLSTAGLLPLCIGMMFSTTVDAQTTTTTWTHCANENQSCSVPGTRQVRYGANGKYAYKSVTNSVQCSNSVFGDPAYGVDKTCGYATTSTTTTTTTTTTTAPTTTTTTSPTTTTATAPAPTSTVLPVPTNIANGSTVSLQCGTTYQGTLNLSGKSNVTVTTSGTCGKASITPGTAVSSWGLYTGNIYSAPINFTPVQVSIGGKPLEAAHWPNRPQTWATSAGSVPNSDLAGATLVTKPNVYAINSQVLSSNSIPTSSPFYVEGKLWMLDSPGEWAVSNGRLYIWAPDGASPEGRVWAAAANVGINADKSSGVTIDNVKVFSGSDGISGAYSSNLNIRNSEIYNSSRDGIYATDATGLVLSNNTINNSVRNGIGGWYNNNGAIVTNNSVSASGTVGMPKPTQAGIFFGNTSKNSKIDGNRVTNSASNGITAYVSSTISNNLVDGACTVLTDGGGIYTNGRTAGYVPLNLRIEGNTVKNVILDGSKGIYLDDASSYVTVTRNNVSATPSGLFIHDGSNNTVTGNNFFSNIKNHVALALTSSNNVFTNNNFNSTGSELTFNLEGSNVQSFGTFDYNTYKSTNVSRFAGAAGTKSYTDWKNYMRQDTHSTMN